MKIHKSITGGRVLEAVMRWERTLDNPGFCLACGEDAEDVEPDAREYVCDACGANRVFGASEVLLMGAYHGEPEPGYDDVD